VAALASTRAKSFAVRLVKIIEAIAFSVKISRIEEATQGSDPAFTAGRVKPANSITRFESLPNVIKNATEVAKKPMANIPIRSKTPINVLATINEKKLARSLTVMNEIDLRRVLSIQTVYL
jgi:hypothetical protein